MKAIKYLCRPHIPVATYFFLGVVEVFAVSADFQVSLYELFELPVVNAFGHLPVGPVALGSYFNFMILIMPLFWVWMTCSYKKSISILRALSFGRLIRLTIVFTCLATLVLVYVLLVGGVDSTVGRSGSFERTMILAASSKARLALYGSYMMTLFLIGTWLSWVAIPLSWRKR